MVVAAGAGDGQAQQAAADDVDPVVDDLVLIVAGTAGRPSRNPCAASGAGIAARRDLVGGDLLDEELVVTAGRR